MRLYWSNIFTLSRSFQVIVMAWRFNVNMIGNVRAHHAHGSGVTGRGQSAPWHFSLGIFCWPTGKRQTRKKGKIERWRGKKGIWKGRVTNWKWREKWWKWAEDLFFFLVTFFLLVFFWNHWNVFGVYPTGKKHILRWEENQEKWFCPLLENIPLNTTGWWNWILCVQESMLSRSAHLINIDFYAFACGGLVLVIQNTKLWHVQGEWVTCRQYSILIFQYKSLVH